MHAPQASSTQQVLPDDGKADPLAALSTVDMEDALSRSRHNYELAGFWLQVCVEVINSAVRLLFFFIVHFMLIIYLFVFTDLKSEGKVVISGQLGDVIEKGHSKFLKIIIFLGLVLIRCCMLIPSLGVTPGQWLCGLEEVNRQGKRLSPQKCAMLCASDFLFHVLFSLLAEWEKLSCFFEILKLAFILITKNKQTLSQLVVGSFVIKKESKVKKHRKRGKRI